MYELDGNSNKKVVTDEGGERGYFGNMKLKKRF